MKKRLWLALLALASLPVQAGGWKSSLLVERGGIQHRFADPCCRYRQEPSRHGYSLIREEGDDGGAVYLITPQGVKHTLGNERIVFSPDRQWAFSEASFIEGYRWQLHDLSAAQDRPLAMPVAWADLEGQKFNGKLVRLLAARWQGARQLKLDWDCAGLGTMSTSLRLTPQGQTSGPRPCSQLQPEPQ
ncbi:hypothetical protein [Chitinilyticum aquatile]|uniref:hypothetical protein n=1 Tax=Chitinilyticum aquatile TaxID=362520 RepID=UPI0004086503|nr:hypothetical protein [Chitinilyticum aquatile]